MRITLYPLTECPRDKRDTKSLSSKFVKRISNFGLRTIVCFALLIQPLPRTSTQNSELHCTSRASRPPRSDYAGLAFQAWVNSEATCARSACSPIMTRVSPARSTRASSGGTRNGPRRTVTRRTDAGSATSASVLPMTCDPWTTGNRSMAAARRLRSCCRVRRS